MNTVASSVLIGGGATALVDLWSLVRRGLFGTALPNYGLVGRWIAGIPRGRFHHPRIATAPALHGERFIGWAAHYAIGIAFAALLLASSGARWLANPTLAPALVFGVATVAAPLLVMQPGMGAGIAASKMPMPGIARLQSLVTHAVFGLGLYASAKLLGGVVA